MLESISPSDLQVGCFYLETYASGFTLFTVTERTFINPDDLQYTIHDYYYSNRANQDTGTYTPSDFDSTIVYPLPSALSPDQVKDLYPELFI